MTKILMTVLLGLSLSLVLPQPIPFAAENMQQTLDGVNYPPGWEVENVETIDLEHVAGEVGRIPKSEQADLKKAGFIEGRAIAISPKELLRGVVLQVLLFKNEAGAKKIQQLCKEATDKELKGMKQEESKKWKVRYTDLYGKGTMIVVLNDYSCIIDFRVGNVLYRVFGLKGTDAELFAERIYSARSVAEKGASRSARPAASKKTAQIVSPAASRRAAPTRQEKAQASVTVTCGNKKFTYDPEVLKKFANADETFEVGKWERFNFANNRRVKPVIYRDNPYIPVAFMKGDEITGYLWIGQDGAAVSDEQTNRALFTYINVFGFEPEDTMKREISSLRKEAARIDKEIEEYAWYKKSAALLKMASNAMSVYLGSLSGTGAAFKISTALTGIDTLQYISRMSELEGYIPPNKLNDYEWHVQIASDEMNVLSIYDCLKQARELSRLKKELDEARFFLDVMAAQDKYKEVKDSLLKNVAGLGWAIFDRWEATGDIAKQASLIAIEYTKLQYAKLQIAQVIEEALNGIQDDREVENITNLYFLKAEASDTKRMLATEMLNAYRDRKNSISGIIGRAKLYLEGRSVDENKTDQMMFDLASMVTMDVDSFVDAKLKTDVMTDLATARARGSKR